MTPAVEFLVEQMYRCQESNRFIDVNIYKSVTRKS